MKLLRSIDYKNYILTDEDIKTIINNGKVSYADENEIKKQAILCEEILYNHTGLILGYGKFKLENSDCENYCHVSIKHNPTQIIRLCVNDYFLDFEEFKTFHYIEDKRKPIIKIGQIYECGMKNKDLMLLDDYFTMVGLKVSGYCNYLNSILKYKAGII